MAIYAVYPQIVTPIRYASLFNATTSDSNFGVATSQDLLPQTLLAYVTVAGDGEGTFSYVFGKTPSASINGPRVFINNTNNVSFGAHSSGTAAAPQRTAGGTTFSDGDYVHIAATWDGGLLATGIAIHLGIANTPLSEVTGYSASTNGTGTVNDGVGNNFHIGNREGTDRTFNGTIYYVARWNRVLTLPELRYAQQNGPLSVPDGLVLCWSGDQDYGPMRLTRSSSTAVTFTGPAPLNARLGSRVERVYFNVGAAAAGGYTSRLALMGAG